MIFLLILLGALLEGMTTACIIYLNRIQTRLHHCCATPDRRTLLGAGSPYLQHRVATLLLQHGRRHQNYATRNPFWKSTLVVFCFGPGWLLLSTCLFCIWWGCKFLVWVSLKGYLCVDSRRAFCDPDGTGEWSCKDHKTPGMVNVKGTCKRSGCLVKATFGQPSSRKREYCANNKKTGMADVHRKMCVVAGCLTGQGHGPASKNPGMVNVKGTRKRNGCLVQATFGKSSSRKREYSANHQKPGMADVPHKMCVVAWAAAKDSRPRHTPCGAHQPCPVLCNSHNALVSWTRVDQTLLVQGARSFCIVPLTFTMPGG